MAKSKVHYLLVKASFKKPVTAADAVRETRNLSAFSYDVHTASVANWEEVAFKLKAIRRVDPAKVPPS